jgi:3-methyladenine DNA glycosylase AlkD
MTKVAHLESWLRQHANQQTAQPMEAYMRHQFPFLGIKLPERVALTKQLWKTYQIEIEAFTFEDIFALWALSEREFQYIAMDLLNMRKKKFAKSDIVFIEQLIVTKSWWDTVDLLAGSIAGAYFVQYPHQISSVIERWISSENIWLKRSAILFQLKYKQKTNPELLFHLIRCCTDSREFFIQKAIGWALREYAKTQPDYVKQFVSETKLAPLSKREALKLLRSSDG